VKGISIRQLAEIHRISSVHLAKYQSQNVDIWDSRAVVRKLWKGRTKPPEWQELIDELTTEDESSHEYWKKEETKERVKKLQLANSLAEGEQFKREDTDAANMALGSAFKLSLMEAKATLPPQLVGLAEAEIEKLLDSVFRKMLEDMSDLGSQLWTQIKDKYARGEDAGPDPIAGGSGDAPQPGSNGKPVVPRKRAARSRARPKS
jgi:hypothetical protein